MGLRTYVYREGFDGGGEMRKRNEGGYEESGLQSLLGEASVIGGLVGEEVGATQFQVASYRGVANTVETDESPWEREQTLSML